MGKEYKILSEREIFSFGDNFTPEQRDHYYSDIQRDYGEKFLDFLMGSFRPLHPILRSFGFQVYATAKRSFENKIKDLEYQLEQQKIMNPISVDMVATISDLSAKLKISCGAFKNVEVWANHLCCNENGIYDVDSADIEILYDIVIEALKLIKGE